VRLLGHRRYSRPRIRRDRQDSRAVLFLALRNVLEMHQSDISRKRLNVSLQLEAARHYAQADPARLQQIYGNILSNAVKFTPYSGQIKISSENDSVSQIVLQFTDDGIGMNNEILGRLFDHSNRGGML